MRLPIGKGVLPKDDVGQLPLGIRHPKLGQPRAPGQKLGAGAAPPLQGDGLNLIRPDPAKAFDHGRMPPVTLRTTPKIRLMTTDKPLICNCYPLFVHRGHSELERLHDHPPPQGQRVGDVDHGGQINLALPSPDQIGHPGI